NSGSRCCVSPCRPRGHRGFVVRAVSAPNGAGETRAYSPRRTSPVEECSVTLAIHGEGSGNVRVSLRAFFVEVHADSGRIVEVEESGFVPISGREDLGQDRKSVV